MRGWDYNVGYHVCIRLFLYHSLIIFFCCFKNQYTFYLFLLFIVFICTIWREHTWESRGARVEVRGLFHMASTFFHWAVLLASPF